MLRIVIFSHSKLHTAALPYTFSVMALYQSQQYLCHSGPKIRLKEDDYERKAFHRGWLAGPKTWNVDFLSLL